MISGEWLRFVLAACLGLVAAGGNLLGGYFVVRKEWPRQFLQYFLALGSGYMLAVVFVEIFPESVRLRGPDAFFYVLIGFFLIHLFEHTIASHFHFGEETHSEEFAHSHARRTVLLGLGLHAFFDGVAIASMVLASGQSRPNAIRAAATLGGATLLGVAVTSIFHGQLDYALPLAGGVTLYVAATDLLPEVNRQPNWRMALLVFSGVAILLILQRFLGG